MKKFQILFVLLILVSAVSAKNDWLVCLYLTVKTYRVGTKLNGQAKYQVEKGEIVGTTVANTPNSFLATDKDYGDFMP